MRNASVLLVALTLTLANATGASADDGLPFHRTTPRGVLDTSDGVLVIGIPGGRAWGVESALRMLPPSGGTVVVHLRIDDPSIREAFVRIAYYGTSPGRSRQLAVTDSEPVEPGTPALVAIPLDPPDGAIAYRVRVLARLRDAGARSRDDAVTARLRIANGAARAGGLESRLLP